MAAFRPWPPEPGPRSVHATLLPGADQGKNRGCHGRGTSARSAILRQYQLCRWCGGDDTDSYYKISRAFLDGQPAGNLTRDHILNNITVYWLTGLRRDSSADQSKLISIRASLGL